MSVTFNIKPKRGLQVRDPDTGLHLKKTGEEKPQNGYWLRRIREGDVVEVKAPAKKPAVKKVAKKVAAKKTIKTETK